MPQFIFLLLAVRKTTITNTDGGSGWREKRGAHTFLLFFRSLVGPHNILAADHVLTAGRRAKILREIQIWGAWL